MVIGYKQKLIWKERERENQIKNTYSKEKEDEENGQRKKEIKSHARAARRETQSLKRQIWCCREKWKTKNVRCRREKKFHQQIKGMPDSIKRLTLATFPCA